MLRAWPGHGMNRPSSTGKPVSAAVIVGREMRETDTLHVLSDRVAKENERSRRRAEKRLANARERLALLTSMRSFGFWRWNRATDEVWASKRARRILGLEARTPLTRDMLLATVHPADRAKITHAIGATTCRSDTVEMELRIGQGVQTHWVTTKVCAYRDANGMILRVVGYVVDKSEGGAEAQFLRQRQITHLTRVAMLGALSGAIAHELQQPLTAVLCDAQAAQLLTSGVDFKVEDLREILSDIINDTKHAGQVIQRLRSLLMRGELELQRVQIEGLLDGVLALCRGTLTERRTQVELRIDAGLPGVMGDRVELQQVLLNLILNASESMINNAPADRRMEIDIAFDAGREAIRTSVLDCGKGIEDDQLEHIFEPFFTTKASGLGLGLAVSRSIVVAHKGRLWATKRSGRGAAFHFTLPIAQRAENNERCHGHAR
jgi:C4-dicarboxylate-specific signal transduction histidine kinase